MSDEQDEMIKDFLVESFENLDVLDQELITLEENPDDTNVMNGIFRIIHTIKGTCGFFNFQNLEGITHVGENLLDSLRSGKKKLTPEITNVLLKLSDAVREILQEIEATGKSGDNYYEDLKFLLQHHNKSVDQTDKEEPSLEEQFQAIVAEREAQERKEVAATENERVDEIEPDEEIQMPPEVVLSGDSPSEDVLVEAMSDSRDSSTSSKDSLKEASTSNSSLQDASLRVDVNLLDELMNLVGELVLARNQLRQITANSEDQAFLSTFQRLNIITTELQEGVMKTRMQPILTVWNKFPRVVRDIARQCGKKVRLEMEGKETELDKTIIEAIKDPLVHIVRNAIDHGLEDPGTRVAAGKNEEGLLLLRAFHEGGYVIIEICDDGGGLKTDKIKKKAVERGLVSTEAVNSMSDQEVHRLIFQPGFSTAEQVTNLSGRGVGMDVVRINIEKIGGSLEVDSDRGKGTKLRIKIPLTLAIVPALIVSTESEVFAIPQVSLIELVRLDEDQFSKELETIRGATFYRLRGNLLPLVYLSKELGLSNVRPQDRSTADGLERVLNIVVVRADTQVFGLVVDEVHDTEEIVVKSVSKAVKKLGAYAGATIMGDGRVALILDVMNLAQRARVLGDRTSAIAEVQEKSSDEQGSTVGGMRSLLIVDLSDHECAAVPLDTVKRLEEFDKTSIESLNGRSVVQYRGGILDLVDLRNGGMGNEDETCQVIVLNDADRLVGFLVGNILDVVKERIEPKRAGSRHGSQGAAIIQEKIMDVLDLHALAM
jgi:two-component system chemotaxis sensor kinase CheA